MIKPTLALIPSAYKGGSPKGTLYSVLPSDGAGDFDFERAGEATRINKDGLIETVDSNVPRLNYPLIDGVVSGCPSLLLEPARTNIIPYSEDFSQSAWSKIGSATITSNSIISPDGTQNADLLVSANATSAQGIQEELSFVNGSDYVISIFAKKKDYNFLRINLGGFNSVFNGSSVWFDLENGVLGTIETGIEASIEDFGNGWYRCIAIQSASATANGRVNYFLGSSDNQNNTIGDGSKGNYIWGAMIEQSSYSTSYIKSNGSQTTRSAETCNNAGDANTFNDSEGVLMAEVSSLTEGGDGRRITLSDGSISDRLLIETDENANTIKFFIAGGGTSRLIATSTTQVQKKSNKLALNYNGTNAKAYINGFSIGEITNANTITGLNTLDLADWDAFTYPYFGKVKQLQYFDTALTDTDLEELTSWTSFNEMAESQLYSIQ